MKRFLAEFCGTFALVLVGTGAIILNDTWGGAIANEGIAISFGLIVMLMIFAFGGISGAHINPAVTVAFWLSGRFPGKLVTRYLLAQILGAIAASLIMYLVFPSHPSLGATVPAGSVWMAFGLEVLMTFFLMSVIFFITSGKRSSITWAGIAVGGAVLLDAWLGGPATGASMNPARSLGPALMIGDLSVIWIYIAAPTFGAALATVTCRIVKRKSCCPGPGGCRPEQ